MLIKNIFFFLFTYVHFIKTQLTDSDRSQMVKIINDDHNEKSGLFKENIESTFKAVFALRQLDEKVHSPNQICRELSFEMNTKATLSMLELNELLSCKLDVNAETFLKNFENNSNSQNLNSVLERIEIENRLKLLNENSLLSYFNLAKSYLNNDNTFLNRPNSNESEAETSILLNSYGIRLLGIISANTQTPELKQKISTLVLAVINNLNKNFYELKDNVGFYFDGRTQAVQVNSHILESMSLIRSLNIVQKNDKTQKILNYLFEFRNNYYTTENIFYFLYGLRASRDIPVFQLDKTFIDEEKNVNLRVVDVFGRENQNVNVELTYKITNDQNSDDEASENQLTLSPSSTSGSIDITNYVNSVGTNYIDIRYTSQNVQTNQSVSGSSRVKFTVLNKVKISHVKMSLANPVEKADEKEITVEFPKRSFKSLKATQNSVIKLKVKINFPNDQIMKVEQVLLRLRHSELNKSFSSYSTEYKKLDDYYIINFDLGDTNLIDPYDGTYEMTLLVSDKNIDKPAIWNFGKVDVKFMKPMDPTNVNPTYKNIQKPKMEYVFAPENTRSNFMASVVFSGIIIFTALAFLRFLSNQGINIRNLPVKSTTAFIFSVGFIAILAILAYVYVLFWVKLNILQTFFILGVLALPALLIGYKTLTLIKIDY